MSLTNPNTPVSQQDLKDLYEQKILPYIGGAFGLVATGIDSANLYSTTERVIGQWIDGKPVYQKTFSGTVESKSSYTAHDLGITGGIDTIVNVSGVMDNNKPMIAISNDAFTASIAFYIYPNDFSTASKRNTYECFAKPDGNQTYVGHTFIFHLQYTKTTDSAVESYGTDTTYSTDEHVVGSWIDGRPVYQKVFQPSATISIGTSWTNLHDVSSLNIEVVTKADIHTYPNAGSHDIDVDVNRSTGYIRAKAPSSINYYDNGFLILQYVKYLSY